MTVVPAQQSGGGGTSGLYDVLELLLDRGVVIDVFLRVSLVGIEILKIDIRIVVASVDTYLRFAEACNRLDLEAGPRKDPGLPGMVGDITESGTAETISDAFAQTREDGEQRPRQRARKSTASRGKEEQE